MFISVSNAISNSFYTKAELVGHLAEIINYFDPSCCDCDSRLLLYVPRETPSLWESATEVADQEYVNGSLKRYRHRLGRSNS